MRVFILADLFTSFLKQFRLWRRIAMGMWLLATKSAEDGLWPHGIYDNLETLETEYRHLDSQRYECIVFRMPELNAVNTLGPDDMFEMRCGDVDWWIAQLRSWES